VSASGANATDLLIARIEAGESPAAALTALIPPQEAELLKRCSTVRSFDADLFRLLAAEANADPQIEPLVMGGYSEEVPSRDGVYRLRDTVRSDHFANWWSGSVEVGPAPPDLANLSRRLVEYYDERGDDVEALYHELAADPDAGLARFEALYAKADADFDLPRCRDLVDVLGERLELLGTHAGELRNRYRAYLDARGYWVEDWYRTARFLEPSATQGVVDSLLNGDHPVLQLSATGGMGKTTLLRWLIARKAVPEPERVACARVDFDMVDTSVAIHNPELVLLELAAQLNEQLHDRPYRELLREHGHRRARLRLRPSSIAEATSGFDNAADVEDIRRRVLAVIRELPASERVLVILDTLEVALFGGGAGSPDALVPLLEAAAELRAGSPSVRMIFSGRYELSGKVEAFDRLFPDAASLELTPFPEAEARRYLTENRGIEQGPLLESGLKAARGVPFKLALVADVVEDRPDLDPAELEKYGVDLTYLIDRILSRVEPDVQWVLRYGAVARVLDLGFVRDVMRPYIRAGMSGQTTRDDPRADPLPPAIVAGRPLFPTDVRRPGEEVDADLLWAGLRQYAGTSSWVNIDQNDPELLRLHPDVVDPLRRVVSKHRVFDDLQADATRYFEGKARSDPGNFARWMREAIFHRFQAAGPDAHTYWRAELDAARDAFDLEPAREIAAEPLAPDYVDDEGNPRRWGGGRRLIGKRTLVEARFERAWADIQYAKQMGLPASDPIWTAAERSITGAETLQAGFARPFVARSRIAIGRSALLLVAGRLDEAREEIAIARRGRMRRDERIWLLVAYADAVGGLDPDEAIRSLETALKLAPVDEQSPWRGRILLALAVHHRATDDFEAAIETCDEARAIAETIGLAELRSDLALRAGAFEDAKDAVDLAATLGLDVPRIAVLASRVQLTLWEPQSALEGAEWGLSEVPAGTASTDQLAVRAALVELRAFSRAELAQAEEALDDLIEAADLWRSAGDPAGVWRSLRRHAEFVLRELGDLNAAASSIDQVERAAYSVDAEARHASLILKAELAQRRAEAAGAREILAGVRHQTVSGHGAAHELVALTLAELALDPKAPLRPLADALARVRPAQARLTLLEPLVRCEPFADGRDAERLRRLVPTGANLPIPLAYADIDLDRVLGRRNAAARKLAQLRDRCAGDPYLLRKWLEASNRAHASLGKPEPQLAERIGASIEAASPLLGAAALVLGALAETGALQGLLRAARERLDRAGTPAGVWNARLHEAAAEEAADPLERRKHLEKAAAVYAELGDLPQRDRVLAAAAPAAKRAAVEVEPPAVIITLSGQGRTVHGRVSAPGRQVRQVEVKLPLLDAPEVGPFSFARAAAVAAEGWDKLRHELGAILAAAADSLSGEPLDLRLRTEDPRLHSMPWEVASVADELLALRPGFRWMYRTTPLGREVRTLRPPAPPSVTLVRAGLALEESSYRGSSQSGFHLERIYAGAGFPVRELDGNEIGRLPEHPVSIVHVAAGVVEARGGGIEVDFGADSGGHYTKTSRGFSGDRVSSTMLDQMLRKLGTRPTVVLDVPAPRSPSETVKQLFLRNALAGELLALGNVRAVVGTGLAPFQLQDRLYSTLMPGLVTGVPLGEVVTSLRRGLAAHRLTEEETIAFGAVALFAEDGDLPASGFA
jgi:hypothetical protein